MNKQDFDSPNKEYIARLDRPTQMRCGSQLHRLSLLRKEILIHDFGFAAASNITWSSDSKYFALNITFNLAEYPIFICRSKDLSFAFLRVKAGGLTNIVCDAKQIRLAYEDSSEGYLNSPYVIGFNADGSRTLAEWPIKRLKAPPDRVVDVSTLSFYPKKDLEDGEARKQILHQQPVYEFLPIEDGYFPFDGPMPMSTSQLINHRPMMLSRLEGFAGFGDRQSQVWLDEVKRTGKPYYPLKEVTWYIGEKKRTIPIAKRHLLKSRKKTCG